MSYSKIIENLYLGNQYSTSTIKNINIIISIGSNSKHENNNVHNVKIPITDKITTDITPYLDKVTDIIYNGLKNNKKILVHCKAGINRSTSFIIAYLIRYNNMTLEQAQQHVLKRRNVKFKNNFMEQIKNKYVNNKESSQISTK